MTTIALDRTAAKQALRTVLSQHGGDTKHPLVVEAIATLADLNPTPAPARNIQLRDGTWLLINAPIFPGGQRLEDGAYRYTLGRLAFNMFQPQDLQVKIDRVLQPVLPIPERSQRSHDIITEFTLVETHAPPLQGMVKNLGVCEPSTDDTLQVQFTGGLLTPKTGSDLLAWNKTFGNQSAKPRSSLKETFKTLFLKLMFGLDAPSDLNPNTGEVAFTMKRSPKGKLQILYLDEDLRITKGDKGTVLVCERQ